MLAALVVRRGSSETPKSADYNLTSVVDQGLTVWAVATTCPISQGKLGQNWPLG